MNCRNIRRLTAEERERHDELAGERYDRVYAEIEAEERTTYEREFGDTYKALHPFILDGARTHFRTLKRIKDESED
jgi:hypothetical protein